jgi:hypothetical protein
MAKCTGYNIIKFVVDLRQIGVFLLSTTVSSTNKTDLNNIAEILLKVALNMNIFSFNSSDSKVTCKYFPSLRVHRSLLYTISKNILLSNH